MNHDLAVVVADKSMAEALRGILSRREALGIRSIGVPTIIVHPRRDPGVWKTGHELLEMYARDHAHGLILLDHLWDGNPHARPESLAEEIEAKCRRSWRDRSRCIVIAPELEVWVWSRSPHVAGVLKWDDNQSLRDWLHGRGLWDAGHVKPADPKKAYLAALREKRVPQSGALFRALAEKVSLRSCDDSAFGRLLQTLRDWFPL